MLIDASGFVPSRRVADASNILINIVIKPPGRQFTGPSSPLSFSAILPFSIRPSLATISAKVYTQDNFWNEHHG